MDHKKLQEELIALQRDLMNGMKSGVSLDLKT